MKSRRFKLNEEQRRWVRNWWKALQPRVEGDAVLPSVLGAMGRGERAQLRRCAEAEELLGHAATLLLAQRLIELNDEKGPVPDTPLSYERLAWVAGVLAVVKEDIHDGKSLALLLGNAAGNERPKMSELRFKMLQSRSSVADLFVQWRRAVQLADGALDVARLADDLLSWQIELELVAARASDGVKFHWACDYYLSSRDRDAAKDVESDKEITQ